MIFCFKTQILRVRQHLDYFVFTRVTDTSHDKSTKRLKRTVIVTLELRLLFGKIRSLENRILATHSPKDTSVYMK